MSHVVTLAKPDASQTKYGHPDFFDRGERIIMVDGLRWGRTKVTSHGVHGTRTTFEQQNGSTIIDRVTDRGREIDVEVRSASRRRDRVWIDHQYRLPDGWKDTEQLTLECVQQLVADGKLRHPDVVKAENEKAAKAREERYAAAQAREDRAFRDKAIATLAGRNIPDFEQAVEAVIAAMRWAQEQ